MKKMFIILLYGFFCYFVAEPINEITWGPLFAPPLPLPTGRIVKVNNVVQLQQAINRAQTGDTILIAPGEYKIQISLSRSGITLRGDTDNPWNVVLCGIHGWDSGYTSSCTDNVINIDAANITIANLTVSECGAYGIKIWCGGGKVKNLNIYNCRFKNCGQRAIKGSGGSVTNKQWAIQGSVRYCQFENTKIPGSNWQSGGDYIAGIDAMCLDNWIISDNIFRNIKGHNGGARAAIFIWVRSKNIIAERNLIINCDRGIAYGNPGTSSAGGEGDFYVTDSIIRNNFITGGPDCGIELWYAPNIKIYNNTIWRPAENWARGIRIGTGSSNVDIVNNLVHGQIKFDGGQAKLRNNLSNQQNKNYFIDVTIGNLALTSLAEKAINKGLVLPEITEDIRQRIRDMQPDIGAWEFGASEKSTLDNISKDDNLLLQNYPNPFNPECYIPYELKERGDVKVRIYNVLGQKVRELEIGQKQASKYITKDKAAYWDGKNNKGKEVVSGVYYYELVVDGKVIGMKKSLVLK